MPGICSKIHKCGNHPPHGESIPKTGWSADVLAHGENVIMVGTVFHDHPMGPHTNEQLSGGSPDVMVNGKPVGRLNDPLDCGAKMIENYDDVVVNG